MQQHGRAGVEVLLLQMAVGKGEGGAGGLMMCLEGELCVICVHVRACLLMHMLA